MDKQIFQDLVVENKEGVIVNAFNSYDLNKKILSRAEYNKFSRPKNINSIFHLLALSSFFFISFLFLENKLFFLYILTLVFTLHYTLNLAHECWHNTLFTSLNLNKHIGRFLSSIIGLPYEMAQNLHFNHHKYLNIEKDPGYIYTNPKLSRKEIIKSLFGISIFMNHLKNINTVIEFFTHRLISIKSSNGASKVKKLNNLSFQNILYVVSVHILIMIIFIFKSNFNSFLLFEYCVIALLPLVDALRTLIDHKKSIYSDSKGYTRNFKITWLDKVITKPYFDWHLLHHLYPQIPQCNLHKVQKLLLTRINHKKYYNSSASNSFGALLSSLSKK